MKTNLLKVAFVVAIALVSGLNMFNVQKVETLSKVALANVEALADLESGNAKYKYCTMHYPCYNQYGVATGKFRADSYQGPSCTHDTPHEHGCTNCKSR